MINTELSLEVSDSSNPKVLRVFDTSHYCNEVENYLLEVLPVNKSSWVTFHVFKDFSLALNSSNLQYKKVGTVEELIDLPDGIYEFKQSIKPNIHTLNHFLHLRTTELQNKISSERLKLINDVCLLKREEFEMNRNKLRNIEEYLLAAKWSVEECTDKVRGKELYDFSSKLLEQYTNECGC